MAPTMGQDHELLDVSEARNRLLSFFSPLGMESVPLAHAAGRVLAQDIVSPLDLPPFDNSAMDGFALRAADVIQASLLSPAELNVVADIPAGNAAAVRIEPGQAARIMTGAAMPAGADCVVPVEDTDFHQRQAGTVAPDKVRIFKALSTGANVRPAGQDLRHGQMVMAAGRKIHPADTGLLAMLGMARPVVWRRPRVAIISSGDELLPPEAPLTPGKIRDANTYTLCGLVDEAGAQAINLGIVADQPLAVEAALSRAIDQAADLIVSSAGVSVGAMDFVRSVVEQKGRLDFWRVNMRPGKPLAFGSYWDTPFVGLPGNPVSAFVGFEVFVRPALLKMQGLRQLLRPAWPARMLEPVESDGRESYLRSVVSWQAGELTARLTGHQGSGNLHSLVQANALLLIPSGVKYVPSGGLVQAWLLDNGSETLATETSPVN